VLNQGMKNAATSPSPPTRASTRGNERHAADGCRLAPV
jgi:hypothetical protein